MRCFSTLLACALLFSGRSLAQGGLVDVSVYDRTEGRRLPVYWHESRAYVAGKPGNEYQVTLRNRQQEELLAVVSVDGVNVITGETAHPSQSGYVLAPRGSLDIQGWRRSLSQTAAFYFTSVSDSYAAITGRRRDVGVIGVALFRKRVETRAPIASAESGPRTSSQPQRDERAEGLGTGHGRHETSHAHHVTFERATSAPADVISIYYDSHANLLARGIIQDHPRAFPGFVPDPRG